MGEQSQYQKGRFLPQPFRAVQTGILQRKCASCGMHTIAGDQCSGCKNKQETHQRESSDFTGRTAPPIIQEILQSTGRPLDATTRDFMETQFGHDFSRVQVHSDTQAARSAGAVNALAYTISNHIAFAENQYAPSTTAGRSLIAHELAHVIQQSGAASAAPLDKIVINQPADAFEKEADAATNRIMGGSSIGRLATSASSAHPMMQRQAAEGDIEKKSPEKKDAGEVIVEGLKTAAEQAADENPQVKKVVIEPVKKKLKSEWNRLGTGEKTATIGVGAAGLGMVGGAMLSDPKGRKQLEGVNLATPFTLIPYMPLSSFRYTLPSGDSPDKRMFKFETSFQADDLINLRTERRGLPKMSLGVNLQWGYDPSTDRLSVLGGDASLGVVPGLTLSAGAYKDVMRPSPSLVNAEGQSVQIKKSSPEFGEPQPIPDVRIMLNVDLLKFKPGDLARQIRSVFD